ncbi:MAG: hypothetical protein LBT23_10010 [Synergistaceae bacterium]|jgi:hypothetical protein|nr:hypothetical protein [Synergistaceae bacterium]
MTPEKQHKMYGVLMFFVVVLLLAAQVMLQYTLKGASEQLVSIRTSLAEDQKKFSSQRTLNERYQPFKSLATGHNGTERQFPVNGRELYAALDAVMKHYSIEFTNNDTNNQGSGNFTLSVSFTGSYYNVIKALAAIRESQYIMRISDIRISAAEGTTVRGSMNIFSTAKSS